MFSEKIIKIAQVDTDPLQDLADSQAKLQNVNLQVLELTEQFDFGTEGSSASFFDFGNIYFWFVLVGLVLLAMGLLFLMLELQQSAGKPVKVKHIEPKPAKQPIISVKKKPVKVKKSKVKKTKSKSIPEPQPVVKRKKKTVKVKVVKVK